MKFINCYNKLEIDRINELMKTNPMLAKFEIEKYLRLDIVENETYHHFCYLVNLAVVNDKLSVENGEILKEGIKEILKITGDYDRLDKSILIDCGCK